ncbi:TMV resistance protein N [Glycine soja]
MATGSPSSSSSSNYDVFLSFRGEDTRHGFTGHLYNTLLSKGIHTFIDDEELQRGEEITPALMKAIQDSRVAITVLSEHYASSSFCLDELATILDQRKRLLVIPVFYKVDPSDVRNQRGSYGEALAELERRFQHDPEKLQKWKMALKQVADLSGYHFKEGDGYDFKFIENIVEQVSRVISLRPLHVADYPVGLESRVLRVRRLLDAGSDDGVHMIGIHGMGGIGKSTLARAVYNELIIAEKFAGLCFLANVRENSSKHGLEHLQGKLLLEILGEKNISLTSKQQGISIIQSRLTGKKQNIITTRDQQLLRSHEVNKIYEVKELDENDALQLLTWEAFKKEKAYPTYEEVLHRVVTYASGLPLALEVIGSHLVGKSTQEWESAIKQYKRIPKKEILDILKVSFDALEEDEKKVFLDIACCFKGWRLTDVERILRGDYDDCMEHHIGVLIKKSLINVSGWDDVVTMHDLIQDMGRQIDQQESSKVSGKRRRLWLTKDIIEVLEDNSESSNLKVLNFEECEFLTEIPDVSDLPNLEELSFDRCGNLITVHHSIGFLSKLKILSAKRCSKLTTFPPLNLTSLETLQLSYCSSLENFPEILGEMKNLLMLELIDLGLKELPVSFQNLVGLETLSLSHCGILLLPINIVMMPKLASLDAESCKGWQWKKSEEGEEKVGSIEIRGVPQNLKEFMAIECISLSSSSLSMLSNQELHEAGQTVFQFPGATIPEWFNHQSRGPSSSFWFRNEFPHNVLCLLLARVECIYEDYIPMLTVFINGKRHKITSWLEYGEGTGVRKVKLNYTYLFDLESAFELDDLSEVALEKEWNHVEITYAGMLETSLVKATGIHVLRQDDIRYDDPYGKRKLEHDLNSFESQPLIKKPRLSRWVGPERIINLLGNAADGALITNAERRYRHISMDSFCRRCHSLEETILHALRDCPEVAAFWRSVLPKKLAPKFFNGDVTVWLERNLDHQSFSEAALFWPTFFGIAVELLWQFRNDLVFDHSGRRGLDLSGAIDIVFKRYKDYMGAHASHNLMTRNLLKWKPENSKDWLLRLNVSGAYDPSSGTAACGGIFRDKDDDRFVLGFSVKLGESWSINEAEILSVYHGMKIARKYDIWGLYRDILRRHSIPISLGIARQHGFGKIRVESDSDKAIEFVQRGCPTSPSTSTSKSTSRRKHCFPLCQELKALTSATNHSYTRHNAAADSFAKFGLSMKQQGASIFSSCPSFCQPFI